jgi:hypothetical protein
VLAVGAVPVGLGSSAHLANHTPAAPVRSQGSCMRSHGVPNFPDPSFSNGQVEFPMLEHIADIHSTQFTRAYRTCRKLIPA